MDKAKKNLVIAVAMLAIVCVIAAAYAVTLNAQLGTEKTKAMQSNDQIAKLKTEAADLQVQLTNATSKANDQMNLINSLQNSVSSLRSSLDATSAELEKFKTAYADLESKLKTQAPVNVPQPAGN